MNGWASFITFKVDKIIFHSQDSCIKWGNQHKRMEVLVKRWILLRRFESNLVSLKIKTWLGLFRSLMGWAHLCFMCQQKRLHSKVRHDYSRIKTLEFIGKDGSPAFSHGVCRSEFSPGPALCRFLYGLQRKSELQISINTSLQLS